MHPPSFPPWPAGFLQKAGSHRWRDLFVRHLGHCRAGGVQCHERPVHENGGRIPVCFRHQQHQVLWRYSPVQVSILGRALSLLPCAKGRPCCCILLPTLLDQAPWWKHRLPAKTISSSGHSPGKRQSRRLMSVTPIKPFQRDCLWPLGTW